MEVLMPSAIAVSAPVPVRRRAHSERHVFGSIGWLRAAVLGANDGIVSTASLIVGVAAASPDRSAILIAGVAGLAAGALSMAAGEYVSVASQSDAENADLARERHELKADPKAELAELTAIYVGRGLTKDLARRVAVQLTRKDAMAAHARDELGLEGLSRARPVQAAVASMAAFTAGALLPVLIVVFTPPERLVYTVSAASLLFLAPLGLFSARISGASAVKAVARVTFWGVAAMAATAGIGAIFGVAGI